SAGAGCSGESALFARDGGGAGHGGAGAVDGAIDQSSDQAADSGCSTDSECTTTQFCSARTCVPRVGNLAGNGDLESGSTAGWYGVFGGGGTLLVSDTT